MGQEERQLQAGWRPQPEAQEEASSGSSERCQPIHQRALCLQGQACLQDCEGLSNEEAQGDGQLSVATWSFASLIFRSFRWAVSPGLLKATVHMTCFASACDSACKRLRWPNRIMLLLW